MEGKDLRTRMASWKLTKIEVRRIAAAKRIQSFYRKHLQKCQTKWSSTKFKVTNETLALTSVLLASHFMHSNVIHAREKQRLKSMEQVSIVKVDKLSSRNEIQSLSTAMQDLLLLRGSPYEMESTSKYRERLVHDDFVNMMSEEWLICSTEERFQVHLPHEPQRMPFYSRFLGFDWKQFFTDTIFISRSGPIHRHIQEMNQGNTSQHHLDGILNHVNALNSIEQWTNTKMALEKKVKKIFWIMRSEMMMPAIRSLGWILSKIWRILFEGVFIDKKSIDQIKQLIHSLGSNVTLILTPTHKSHLDYLLVSYVCFAYGLPLPRIAAGNNLNLPLVGSYLRANGSFFIRRSYQGDSLYKEILTSYVHELLKDGAPLEVFVEGGRSRHGRVMKPKFGFFNMIASYLEMNPERDVLVVPISLDYDRVLEVPDYTAQLLGKPKQKESIWNLFKSIVSLFFTRCGHAYIRFGTPMSMQHHLEHFGMDSFTNRVAYRMQAAATITSSAIVSSILLAKRHNKNQSMNGLCEDATNIVQLLRKHGAIVAPFDSIQEMVSHGIDVLQIPRNGTCFYINSNDAAYVLELSFYRNQLLHIFLPTSLLAIIVTGRIEHNSSLHLDDIVRDANLLWTYCNHLCPHDVVNFKEIAMTWVNDMPFVHIHGDRLAIEINRWFSNDTIHFMNMLLWPFIETMKTTLALFESTCSHEEGHVLVYVRTKSMEFLEAHSTEVIKHVLGSLVSMEILIKENGMYQLKNTYLLERLVECIDVIQPIRRKVWQNNGPRRQPIQVSPLLKWLQLTHTL